MVRLLSGGNATGTIAAGMPTTTTRNALVHEKGLDTREPLPRSASGCSEEAVVIEAFALRAFAHLNQLIRAQVHFLAVAVVVVAAASGTLSDS